ncbi:aldo/keto reductase [Paenibacillus aurantiacus]|uniref:Aldo/keto reductase n=1 Tax=Paenibacillus aurantiacus TaxID=1936118 RepID=A0ABV5KVD8_9BACL
MQYTALGRSGLLVSRLAFGAMTFGSGNNPSVYKVDHEGAKQLIDRALDAGINFFDTADGYADGQSEEMLGQLLGSRRHSTVIATKAGFRNGPSLVQAGLSRKHLFAACEASLKRLNTDYIDLYVVHKTDPYTPLEETLEALNRSRARRQNPLYRLFELAGLAGRPSGDDPARARVGSIHQRSALLLARRPRHRA